MAREIVIRTWCDVCSDEGAQRPGTGTTMQIGDVGPASLDLCAEHFASMLGPLTAALRAHGAPQGRPTAPHPTRPRARRVSQGADVTMVCLLCWHGYRSDSGVDRHMSIEHGVPARGPWFRVLEEPLCPVCGWRGKSDSARRFNEHLRTHGDSDVHPSMKYVEQARAGDPSGWVAKALGSRYVPAPHIGPSPNDQESEAR